MSKTTITTDECGIDRRTFVRSSAGVVTLATTGGIATQSDWGPIGNSRAVGALTILGATFAAGGIAGWLGRSQIQPAEDEFQEARKKELKARMVADLTEIQSRARSHTDTFRNVERFVKEYVRQNVAFTIEEAAATGKSQSETVTLVENEVEKSVSYWIRQHYKEWNDILTQLGRRASLLSNISTNLLELKTEEDSNNLEPELREYFEEGDGETLTLPNGQSMNVGNPNAHGTLLLQISQGTTAEDIGALWMKAINELNEPSMKVLDGKKWKQITDDLYQLAEDEKSNAADLVAQLYPALKNDEVEISKASSARSILNASENPDDYGQAAGVYRSMSLPESHTRCVIECEGCLVECLLFRNVGGSTLPVNKKIIPADEPGNIELSGKVVDVNPSYGPEGPDPKEITINIARESGPAELADVKLSDSDSYSAVDGLKLSDTADTNGHATLAVDNRLEAVDISIQHDGDLYHTTLDLSEGSTFNVQFEAGKDDRGNVERGLLNYSIEVGDLINGELTQPFEIVDTDDGSSTVEFSDPTFIETDPDHDPKETAERLREAHEQEQETRDGVDDAATGGNGGLGLGGVGVGSKIKKFVAGCVAVMLGLAGINAASG